MKIVSGIFFIAIGGLAFWKPHFFVRHKITKFLERRKPDDMDYIFGYLAGLFFVIFGFLFMFQ